MMIVGNRLAEDVVARSVDHGFSNVTHHRFVVRMTTVRLSGNEGNEQHGESQKAVKQCGTQRLTSILRKQAGFMQT